VFSPRWKYAPLEMPAPLTATSRIRLPVVDAAMLVRRQAKVVDRIEQQVTTMLADEAADETPMPARVAEFGDHVCAMSDVDTSSPARPVVFDWLRAGWTVGVVEDADGAGIAGESERHHAAVVERLRKRMYDVVREHDVDAVRESSDACLLALHGGYYLQRDPSATTATLVSSWNEG
jgi:hypothetical protein